MLKNLAFSLFHKKLQVESKRTDKDSALISNAFTKRKVLGLLSLQTVPEGKKKIAFLAQL